MKLTPDQISAFHAAVYSHYDANRREMPWRQDTSFYSVLVSELMLQQTQVPRVIPKYQEFMKKFPLMSVLAQSPLSEVIIA